MPRVLVTGMSGTGKSTLLEGLARRGHAVVDTDYDGWVLADGRWDEPRMHDLLDRLSSVVVSGTVDNQVVFYDRFDQVVLLSAPLDTLLQRVQNGPRTPTEAVRRGAKRLRTTSKQSSRCCGRAPVSNWMVELSPPLWLKLSRRS